MKKIAFLLLVALMVSCNNSEKTSISGKYKFNIIEDKDGEAAKQGDFLFISLKAIDENDSLWLNTYDRPDPYFIRKDTAMWNAGKQGFFEIYNDLSEGDSIKFTVTAEQVFTETYGMPVLAKIKPELKVTFYSQLTEIKDSVQFMTYYQEMQMKAQMEMMAEMEKQMEVDGKIIDDYLSENGISYETTEGGVRYTITSVGKGENAQPGDSIKAKYSGYLMDKTPFDSGTYDFVIDRSSVIQGWHDGFKALNKGSKATLYIPSALGYGPRSTGPIPANSVLVFDVEVLDLK
ncbi:MAG: FKBP-type peptidyl-prolyl cis-trans isomerase [Cyclobacteriaceae bacterium]|nr:FKBP-type peptidyl-prolyl cis-trans isomerase [Cyclobacteriaceae bacterium]